MCFIRIRPHHAPLTPPGAAPTLTKLHEKDFLGSTSTDSSSRNNYQHHHKKKTKKKDNSSSNHEPDRTPPMDLGNPTTERIRDSLDVTAFLEPIRTKSQEEVEQILSKKTGGMLAKGHD